MLHVPELLLTNAQAVILVPTFYLATLLVSRVMSTATTSRDLNASSVTLLARLVADL